MNAHRVNARTLKPVVICSVCCTASLRTGVPEVVAVRSNVGRFRGSAFPVWRCADCGSIHAAREVDLGSRYQDYPDHAPVALDWRRRLLFRGQLRRLKAAGLKRDMRILDYGCGNGALVAYLKLRGYAGAVGFDRFTPAFSSTIPLWPRFDMVIAQNVIEHSSNIVGFMRDLARLVRPGGVLFVGTTNAAAIDLRAPDAFADTLHQPFHRKILSLRALLVLGHRNGLALERLYHTTYTDTRIPLLNERFMALRTAWVNDTGDTPLLPVKSRHRRRFWTWRALLLALFGSFLSRKTHVVAVFRRNQAPSTGEARP